MLGIPDIQIWFQEIKQTAFRERGIVTHKINSDLPSLRVLACDFRDLFAISRISSGTVNNKRKNIYKAPVYNFEVSSKTTRRSMAFCHF